MPAAPEDDDVGEPGKLSYVSGSLRRELIEEIKQQQGPSREEQIAHHQGVLRQADADLNAPSGSAENRRYWTRGGSQQALDSRRALEALSNPTSVEDQQ
jgi:hypothetical protein